MKSITLKTIETITKNDVDMIKSVEETNESFLIFLNLSKDIDIFIESFMTENKNKRNYDYKNYKKEIISLNKKAIDDRKKEIKDLYIRRYLSFNNILLPKPGIIIELKKKLKYKNIIKNIRKTYKKFNNKNLNEKVLLKLNKEKFSYLEKTIIDLTLLPKD